MMIMIKAMIKFLGGFKMGNGRLGTVSPSSLADKQIMEGAAVLSRPHLLPLKNAMFFMLAASAFWPLCLSGASENKRIMPGDGRIFSAPYGAESPTIDGNLDEPAWSDALLFTDFRWRHENTPVAASVNTELRVMHDSENLYLGFKCFTEDVAKLRATAPCNGCYDIRDDRVEIYFDALGSDAGPLQLIIMNCDGIFKRMIWRSIRVVDLRQPRLEVASGRGGDYWTLEIRLPLQELGFASLAGEICKINVERQHPHRGSTTLVPTPPGKSALNEMAGIYFEPAAQNEHLKLTSVSRGALSIDGALTGANTAKYSVKNLSGDVFNIRFAVENIISGKIENAVSHEVVATRQEDSVEFTYEILGRAGEQVRFTATDAATSGILYSNTYDVEIIHPACRVYKLQDPLFEELLDASAKKDPRLNGSILWQSPIYATYYANTYYTSLKYANEYSFDEIHRSVKDSGFHWFTGPCRDDVENVPSIWRNGNHSLPERTGPPSCFSAIAEGVRTKNWAKPVLYSPYGLIGGDEKNAPGLNWKKAFGFTFDPVNARAYIDASVEIAKKYRNEMWGVGAGDEQFMQNYMKLIAVLKEDAQDEKAYPDSPLRLLDKEVREQYGFGKYGIPFDLDKKDPSYPFAHCAFSRWLQNRMRPVNIELAQKIKSAAPEMMILSEDCMGGLDEDISSFDEYAEVATLQLAHPYSMQQQKWTCRTKIVKDISGLDYVLPCPHEAVSGYEDGAANPDEIIELYSQLLRGGATGIHAWPAAMGGGAQLIPNARSVVVGYPIAWKLMMAVGKIMHELPPLKFPKPDSAIHLSETSSQRCRDTRYPWNALIRYENLFAHIGVVARGWSKFTSDSRVKSGKDNLNDFPVVYLPDMKYAEPELAEKLLAFCRNGGTLVCLDPDAFEYGLDGNPMTAWREKLFGVRRVGAATAATMEFNFGSLKTNLTVMDVNIADLEIQDKNTEIIGHLDNGKPGAVMKTMGKGRALFFAYLPINDATVESDEYKTFWTAFHKELGCSTGHDIWRFKLPMPDVGELVPAVPSGRCLTGNYAVWHKHELQSGTPGINMPMEGIYTMRAGAETRGPSLIGDGKLTDRLKAARQAKILDACGVRDRLAKPGDVEEWIETFTGKKPVEIIFNFTQACVFEKLNLWFSGELNGFEVHAGKDGRNWDKVGAFDEIITTGDMEVKQISAALAPQKDAVKHLKIVCKAGTTDDSILKLAELEIWGDCPELTGSDVHAQKQGFAEDFEAQFSHDARGNRIENWSWNTSSFPKDNGACAYEKDGASGQSALKITATPDGRGAGVWGGGRRISARAGAKLTIRMEIKGKADCQVGLACYDAERRFLASAMSEKFTADTGQWTSHEIVLTVPESEKGATDSVVLMVNVAPGGELLINNLDVSVKTTI